MPKSRLDVAGRDARSTPGSAHLNEPRVRTKQSDTLPAQLGDTLPQCAKQCLTAYAEQGWTCSDNNSRCFCSQYSSQGFTLGELAYICVQQKCRQNGHAEAVAAYQICSGVDGAASATHSTLTVPASTATTSSPTSTGLNNGQSQAPASLQTSQTSPTRASTIQTSVRATTSKMPSSTASISTAGTTMSASSAATAQSSSDKSTSLSNAQAIGISVACMGGIMLAVGIFYLIVCLRRRKTKVRDEKQERDSYDFVDEAPPRFSPFHFGYADPRGPLGGFYGQRAELTSEKRDSKWYRENFLAEPVSRFEKGLDFSPKSLQSRSTISQLLPEKPKATPPQLRSKPSPRPPSNYTVPTVFEEDRSPQMHSAMFPPPVGLPANPKAFHYPQVAKPQQARYAPQLTQSPASMRQPSLSLEIPKQAGRVVKSPVQMYSQGPRPRQRSPVQRERSVSEARSSRSAGSFLNYYASPEADNMRSPESPTPIDDHAQTRRAVPTAITVTKPTYPPRAVRVVSGASDTSFESTDPDEPTPPEEDDKQLTPVKEHSPIASIKYPKVPRSSNQAIPRSPPIGMRTSPSFGAKVSPTSRPTRRPQAANSPPQGVPGRKHSAQMEATAVRPTSQIPRKPVPSYQPRQQPFTPERQMQKDSNLSGSTLAAKRRGNTAAHDLERNLHIKNSSYWSLQSKQDGMENPLPPPVPATRRSPHNSPLKGYGRVASRNNSPVTTRPSDHQQSAQQHQQRRFPVRPAEGSTEYRQPGGNSTSGVKPAPKEVEVGGPLRSPLWEPKLTPSRKGEDLYLQVGVATPRTENFGRMSTEYRGRGA